MHNKKYLVREVFYSLQGEGIRAGTAAVFIRFAGCNLRCTKQGVGFDCDTDWDTAAAKEMTAAQIVEAARRARAGRMFNWAVLTGGEPALQVDDVLIRMLRASGLLLAIESNGTIPFNVKGISWVCISPKTPADQLAIRCVNEAKFVFWAGRDDLPRVPVDTGIVADHYLVSPAWGTEDAVKENMRAAVSFVRDNPRWRLSVQLHKILEIR